MCGMFPGIQVLVWNSSLEKLESWPLNTGVIARALPGLLTLVMILVPLNAIASPPSPRLLPQVNIWKQVKSASNERRQT